MYNTSQCFHSYRTKLGPVPLTVEENESSEDRNSRNAEELGPDFRTFCLKSLAYMELIIALKSMDPNTAQVSNSDFVSFVALWPWTSHLLCRPAICLMELAEVPMLHGVSAGIKVRLHTVAWNYISTILVLVPLLYFIFMNKNKIEAGRKTSKKGLF